LNSKVTVWTDKVDNFSRETPTAFAAKVALSSSAHRGPDT